MVIVSIPFKRESVSKVNTIFFVGTSSTSFNSLQTGKCIQRYIRRWGVPRRPLLLFQFPSNGKVYPKHTRTERSSFPGNVSIPFKRESVSKAPFSPPLTNPSRLLFQFPSNGKVYPKPLRQEHTKETKVRSVSIPFKRESVSKGWSTSDDVPGSRKGFNSLQTGKCIQSFGSNINRSTISAVSIPFKRESVSKGFGATRVIFDSYRFNSLQTGKCIQSMFTVAIHTLFLCDVFQFPSNGKVYPKCVRKSRYKRCEVSIPFKRESVSKGTKYKPLDTHKKFQFPSNGKVYPKCVRKSRYKRCEVSIPFKRESVSKANFLGFGRNAFCRFNSLQTGKCIQSRKIKRIVAGVDSEFQFPSNGKVYPKLTPTVGRMKGTEFQFPSNGKVYPKASGGTIFDYQGYEFQFPSNGKVYPKWLSIVLVVWFF